MRGALVVLSLLLAGCAGGDAVEESVPPKQSEPAVEASQNASGPELLRVASCEMPDRVVFAPAGPQDMVPSHCSFAGLEVPEQARSLRLNFTYDALHATDEFGIRLADPGRCDATGGDGCNIAEAFGPSPVTLDVQAVALEGLDLAGLDASAIGYGADATFHLEVAFYSSDEPV